MPNRAARPREGRIRFVMILIVVDFPAPFGPRKPRDVPFGTVRSSDFRAVKWPYSLPSLSRRTGNSTATDSVREASIVDIAIYRDILKLLEGIPRTEFRERFNAREAEGMTENPGDLTCSMILIAPAVPRMQAGHVDIGSTFGRSTVDRPDAVASVRGERARVPCRPPAHGLHGTDGHLLCVDDRPAYHRRIPRSVVLGRRPRRGDRGAPVLLGECPGRGTSDLALHDAHPRGHAPPLRPISLLEPDGERARRRMVLACHLCGRPGRDVDHLDAAAAGAGNRSAARASRADVDAYRGPRTRSRHARVRPGSLLVAGHREAGVALGTDPAHGAGDRSVAHRDRLRRVPREPRERFPPDPATRRRLHRLRGLAIHRGRAVCRRRELERLVRMGIPRFLGEHPAGGPLRLARPANVRHFLRTAPGPTQSGMKTESTSSSADQICSGRAPRDLRRPSDSDRDGFRRDPRARTPGRCRGSNRGLQERAEFPDRPCVLLGWPNLLRGERHWEYPNHLSREPDAPTDAILHAPEHRTCTCTRRTTTS